MIAFSSSALCKSSGSLNPSTVADVFRCCVLCGLSELNVLFSAFRDPVELTDFLALFQSGFLSDLRRNGVKSVRFRLRCHQFDLPDMGQPSVF